MKRKKDVVVRVSDTNYKRIKELMDAVEGAEQKRPTLNETMNKLLDTMDKIAGAETVYVVGGKAFFDLADARGEAIIQAVKDGRPPEWPMTCLWVSNDKGV